MACAPTTPDYGFNRICKTIFGTLAIAAQRPSLAFAHFEEVVSTIDIVPLAEDDPEVIDLCKSYDVNPQMATCPFRMSWEGESDWDDNEVVKGTTVLVPIPRP